MAVSGIDVIVTVGAGIVACVAFTSVGVAIRVAVVASVDVGVAVIVARVTVGVNASSSRGCWSG